jgi:hypothetical protein
MNFTVVEPEVAGGWGPNTAADVSVHPPRVTRLHYELEEWLGDDILESFPCFIVSDRLARELMRSALSGFALAAVEVSTSPVFEELYPNRELPTFHWLKVSGQAALDDFGLAADYRLVASQPAVEILSGFNIGHARLEPL